MPLEGDAKREYNKQYNQRKKEQKLSGERAKADFDKCAALDAEGKTAPHEVETYTDLCKIYYGVDRDEDPNKSRYLKSKEKRIVVAGKQILYKDCTFDLWLEHRANHYKDFWLFMHTLRGTWNQQAHKLLADFFGDKDNTMLLPDYTEDDLNNFLMAQGEYHDFLLLFPRAFRKTTVNSIDSAHWIINTHGDIVILVITSTNFLAAKILREIKGFFTVKDFDNPTEFQKIFPEHCVPEGSKEAGDQKTYRSPAARLELRDPTVSIKSMESKGFAGTRAHILKLDDCVDESNYQTVENRLKTQEKFDAASELVVRPYGRIYVVGTRWTDGTSGDMIDEDGVARSVPDLYGTIQRREDESESKELRYLCCPAWTPLSEAADKKIHDLEEDDVTLLWPDGPGSFKELKKKLRKNEILFRCNQLNQPAAVLNQEIFINHFTDGLLTRIQVNVSHIKDKLVTGKKFIIWDTANSPRATSDFSAGVVYFIDEVPDQDPIAYLLEVKLGHWTNSQLAQQIVALHKKWTPQQTLIEELASTSSSFKKEILDEQLRQETGYWEPYWFPASKELMAKQNRIVALEPLMVHGRLKICIGDNTNAVLWIDELKKQFLGYSGHKRNKNYVGGRHDDVPDAMGYLEKLMPMGINTVENKALRDILKEKQENDKVNSMIFGDVSFSSVTKTSDWLGQNKPYNSEQVPVEEDYNPIYNALKPLQRN